MPENYIAMFSTPGREEALETIRLAETHIDNAARLIKGGKKFPQSHLTVKDKINSSIVNDIFYPVFVHAKKFYAADSCISCGNVRIYVRWGISIWITGNRCGEKIVRIVWHVSAAVRKRQLSMGGIVWGCRGIFVRNRSNAGAIVSPLIRKT